MAQDLTGYNSKIFSKKLLVTLNKDSVMMPLVNVDHEAEIKNEGESVIIRSVPKISTGDYTGTINYGELQSPTITLDIDQATYFAFKIGDIAQAQSNIDILKNCLAQAKIDVELAKDTRLLAHVADVDAGNIIATSQLTKLNAYDKFIALNKILKKNGVKANMKPWVVINPDIEEVLVKSPEFIQSGKLGEETLTQGCIGRIAGLNVVVSDNMSDVNGTYNIMAGCKASITFASQVVKVRIKELEGSFDVAASGLYVYGSKMVLPKTAAKLVVTL